MSTPVSAAPTSTRRAPRLRRLRPRRAAEVAVALVLPWSIVAGACASDPIDEPAPTTSDPADPAAEDAAGTPSSTPIPPLRLEALDVDLDQPIAAVASPSGDGLLVAQRGGEIVELTFDADGGVQDVVPVLDVSDDVGEAGGERGLLGLAVDPQGEELYVSYTRAGDGASQLESYRLTAGDGATTVDESSRRTLVDVDQPFANHNGGHVAVGPDGMVYLGLGDGGGGGDPEGRAQDRGTLLGKVLRLDPAAADGVPADNPFVDTDGALPEIWLTGVRNPWRFSFDRQTGDLWVADVGQDDLEEVTVLRAADGGGRGANLGWDLFEGDAEFADADPAPGDASAGPFTDPQFTYGRDQGCSITGGVVYRGERIPGLAGRYVFSDYCVPGLRVLTDRGGELVEETLGVELPAVASFAEDRRGEVYVLSLEEGLHRLTPG